MLDRMVLKAVLDEVQRSENATEKRSAEWALRKRRRGA